MQGSTVFHLILSVAPLWGYYIVSEMRTLELLLTNLTAVKRHACVGTRACEGSCVLGLEGAHLASLLSVLWQSPSVEQLVGEGSRALPNPPLPHTLMVGEGLPNPGPRLTHPRPSQPTQH